MKSFHRPRFVMLSVGVGLISACGGGGGGGSGSSKFTIVEASNGFGRMLPYQIAERDAVGNPTTRVIEITSLADLVDNVTAANPVLPATEFPTEAILPSNVAGNHFIYVRFSQDIEVDSVLDPAVSAAVTSNLTNAIEIQLVQPNGVTIQPRGRGFIAGRSYGPTLDLANPGNLQLEQWVTLNTSTGNLEAAVVDGGLPGVGFPGTQGGFAGDDVLVDPNTFVFVLDTDGNLATHETFPTGVQVQMRINEDVVSTVGRNIEEIGVASATVGPDTLAPAVLGPSNAPVIIPGPNEVDVDPETHIEVQFTEPIQILSIASLDESKPPTISAAIQIQFGPPTQRVQVPYFIRPFSIYDLSRLELVPAYNFPGSGPEIAGDTCGTFGVVTVTFNPQQYQDLNGNRNTGGSPVEFTTREGPGLVNAPVVPDAIYLGRAGSTPGLSVVDLYGFGAGTGNPTYDQTRPIQEGNSNYPNNPNVSVLGNSLIPPLTPGTCTVDGGSEGVFTLTKDSSLGDLLARSPILESVEDIVIGHALDNTFNNAAPFGCQSGGGNICASTGLKSALLAAGGPNSLAPSTTSTLPVKIVQGGENLVSFAPAPNPPPLVFPPLCLSPLINGQEPTSTVSGFTFTNLLVPGANSRGNPGLNRPPTNLIVTNQNSFFDGPNVPQPSVSTCGTFITRQQIGHFLYVVDRVAGEVVVLNSNRFTVIDRIRTPDPTSLAMSPNLDLLAVTNESADQVSFIDTDPSSSSFHEIVRNVSVGVGPTGIAWEPGNEDIFVCNQADGSVSILSAFSLRPRKTIRNQLTRPIDVAVTPRQFGFGFLRGVYFGYILNQDGTVAVFESGPDGVNGWGYDDTIGSLPFRFFQPKAIQPDVQRLNSAVWIAHENPLTVNGDPTGQTGGALSNVGISSANSGIIPLSTGPVVNPQFRNIEFGVFTSVGEGPIGLSGVPTDMAFDNMLNVSALTNFSTQFSAGQPLSINGKAIIRFNGNAYAPTAAPQFMFLAVPNPGVVDVLELSTGTVQRVDANVFQSGVQSISAPNVQVVADFFRQ
jgi:DNA-binding beta-propeller fold protein YncE